MSDQRNGIKGDLSRNDSFDSHAASSGSRYKFQFEAPEDKRASIQEPEPKPRTDPLPPSIEQTGRAFSWKPILIAASAVIVFVVICASAFKLFGPGNKNSGNPSPGKESTISEAQRGNSSAHSSSTQQYSAEQLSDSCDFILCEGYDFVGNKYELVADQSENSLGYEITVGIIKNNNWLYPLSSSFPFLGERGLFHVTAPMGSKSGTALSTVGEQNTVIQSMYFVDSGAFLMDSYTTNDSLSLYDHTKVIFSCDIQQSKTFDCDTGEYTLVYESKDAKLDSGTDYLWYGEINTDNGEIIVYETIRNSVYQNDDTYDWYIFDFQDLNQDLIASNMDIYPRGPLSEGLILGNDNVFYDKNMKQVVDLTAFNIYSYEDACFHNGLYTFEAVNSIGNHFNVTVDKSGNIVSEIEI